MRNILCKKFTPIIGRNHRYISITLIILLGDVFWMRIKGDYFSIFMKWLADDTSQPKKQPLRHYIWDFTSQLYSRMLIIFVGDAIDAKNLENFPKGI